VKRMLIPAGALLLAACQDVQAPAPPPTRPAVSARPSMLRSGGARPGHHIVVFKQTVADPAALARSLVAAHRGVLEFTYRNAIKGFSAELSDSAVASVRQHPDVAYVEPDGYVSAITTETNATWGIDRVDQRGLPLDATYSYGATGNGVNAYIIDTGIRTTHTEFGGRASAVFDAIGDGNGSGDCNGHGTHVSGTVGGATYGIAKQVKLFSVRVLDCTGSGTYSGVIAGVDWVTANHVSPAVANMSLGGPASTALDQAVANSIASGVTYAIAAGNDNLDACGGSPARVPAAITVGATSMTDARASFSDFGSCVDIFAPGVGITSAYNGSDTQTAVLSGTSMATPHVVGAAARYLELNPTAAPAAVTTALTSNATTGVISNPGTGSPNLLLYTAFMDGSPPPPNQPPVPQFTISCTNLTCTFDSSGSTDDVGITGRQWFFGDGSTGGNVVAPTKTYAVAGTYSVRLNVIDGGGLWRSLTQQVTVTATANQPPVAQFTFSCTNLACTFDSSGSTDDVGITNRAWTFGDGGTAGNVVAPSRTYAAAGTYSVTLTVTDAGGLSNAITKQVSVTAPPTNQPPVPSFTISCTNLTCTFDSSGSTDDVGITGRQWFFGDGTTGGDIVAPTKTYAAPGTYSVRLNVIDGGGLWRSLTQQVTVP